MIGQFFSAPDYNNQNSRAYTPHVTVTLSPNLCNSYIIRILDKNFLLFDFKGLFSNLVSLHH